MAHAPGRKLYLTVNCVAGTKVTDIINYLLSHSLVTGVYPDREQIAVPDMFAALEMLMAVLPDSVHPTDEDGQSCWDWCWDELDEEAQDMVKDARKMARAAIAKAKGK